MRRSHLVGLFLWRAGLLLVSSYSLFRVARYALKYVELPDQVELGAGIALTGAGLVLASFVLERAVDARAERGLSE